jgi:aarF domain-containing kinase
VAVLSGMMGSIEPSVRQALIRATLHLVNREYELLAEDFVALGLLPRGSDMDAVIPALTGKTHMCCADR